MCGYAQDYFAAQSRNTQLLYDVRQLQKQKDELISQYEAHLSLCHNIFTEVDRSQTVDHPASQTICTGTMPQYAVITSGQQQFLSPVLLLSSDDSSSVPPSTPVQLVSVAPLDAHFAEGVDVNIVNSSMIVKRESYSAASETQLINGDTAVRGVNKDKMVNGVCISNSTVGDEVSQVLPAAVDTQTKSCTAVVADAEKTVDGISSVPVSPVTKPACSTRRRRSLPSLPHTSEPADKPPKRATTRHMSSDQLPTKKTAADTDNLPSFLSSMTDDE